VQGANAKIYIYVTWFIDFYKVNIYTCMKFLLSVEMCHLNVYQSMWFDLACGNVSVNLLKPTGYVMHHQFNIQQL